MFSIEHLRRVWHADRGPLLLRTPGPVPLGLAYVLLVDTNPFPNLSLFFRTMLFEYLSVLSRFYFMSIGGDGQFHTSIYEKQDDFNFNITNFPFLRVNIPSSSADGVFISQLIRYARACSSYGCFILRARRLSSNLLKQGYLVEDLKSSFRKFNGRYGDLIQQYEV